MAQNYVICLCRMCIYNDDQRCKRVEIVIGSEATCLSKRSKCQK